MSNSGSLKIRYHNISAGDIVAGIVRTGVGGISIVEIPQVPCSLVLQIALHYRCSPRFLT